jgi:hypothetical protein
MGVSCPSARTCAAVGSDDIGLCGTDGYGSDYYVAVFGFWTSRRWSLRRHPDLGCSGSSDNAGGNGLNEVSCTSTAACTAVGTEVYRWEGSRWTIEPAPLGGDVLSGVSCTSERACTAVGSWIYTWNGHAWSRVRNAPPPGLDSVSCTSRESCVAVGRYEDRRGTDQMIVVSIGFGNAREG